MGVSFDTIIGDASLKRVSFYTIIGDPRFLKVRLQLSYYWRRTLCVSPLWVLATYNRRPTVRICVSNEAKRASLNCLSLTCLISQGAAQTVLSCVRNKRVVACCCADVSVLCCRLAVHHVVRCHAGSIVSKSSSCTCLCIVE